jgi:hypothetical protein
MITTIKASNGIGGDKDYILDKTDYTKYHYRGDKIPIELEVGENSFYLLGEFFILSLKEDNEDKLKFKNIDKIILNQIEKDYLKIKYLNDNGDRILVGIIVNNIQYLNEKFNMPGFLYFCEGTTPSNEKIFKIGITMEDKARKEDYIPEVITNRLKGFAKKAQITFDYSSIKWVKFFDGNLLWEIEESIHKRCRQNKDAIIPNMSREVYKWLDDTDVFIDYIILSIKSLNSVICPKNVQ